MPYFRHIFAEKLPVDVVSLAIDENRAALRFLNFIPEECVPSRVCEGSVQDLRTTRVLSERFVSLEQTQCFYRIQGRCAVIFAEAVLDKTAPEFKRIWMPGTHFVFYLDPARGMKIDAKGALTMFSRRNTAELIRYTGGVWCFDLWVRNTEAPLTECSRSITTAPGTILITNVDNLGEKWPAEKVMEGGQSKWLSLSYLLTPDEPSVVPNGKLGFTFEILDGKTGERAKDVTWDNYQIEVLDGYAPHKRFSVKNGVGRFYAHALLLEDGDTMRIKINKPFNTGLAECAVCVRL